MNNVSPFELLKSLFPGYFDVSGVWGVAEILIELGHEHKGPSLATCEIALRHKDEIQVALVKRRLLGKVIEGEKEAYSLMSTDRYLKNAKQMSLTTKRKELAERRYVTLPVEI